MLPANGRYVSRYVSSAPILFLIWYEYMKLYTRPRHAKVEVGSRVGVEVGVGSLVSVGEGEKEKEREKKKNKPTGFSSLSHDETNDTTCLFFYS